MWLLHPPKSRRRWHVFTWLAAVPALVFVALVQVAGVQVGDHQLLHEFHSIEVRSSDESKNAVLPGADESPLPALVEEHLHGWPLTWLRRAQGFGPPPWRSSPLLFSPASMSDPKCQPVEALAIGHHRISWSARKAWPGDADRQRLYPLGLFVNLVVAGLVLAIPMAGVEVWLRRRGGFWRFKIIDFLVIVALIAAGLAFYRWDRAEYGRETHILATVFYKGLIYVEMENVGPEWIARLVGNRHAVPFMQRIQGLVLDDIDPHKEHLPRLADFHYLRRISIQGTDLSLRVAESGEIEQIEIDGTPINNDFTPYIDALANLPPLKEVTLNFAPLPEDLAPLQKLRKLKLLAFDPTYFSENEIAQLQSDLPGVKLQKLDLLSPVPSSREVAYLIRLNRRRRCHCTLHEDATALHWSGVPFSAELLEPLAPILPKIRKLTLVDARLREGEWADLSQFTSLSEISFRITHIPREFVEHIAELPQLDAIHLDLNPVLIEPILALRHNPPRAVVVDCYLYDEQLAQLREAFGDRLHFPEP